MTGFSADSGEPETEDEHYTIPAQPYKDYSISVTAETGAGFGDTAKYENTVQVVLERN